MVSRQAIPFHVSAGQFLKAYYENKAPDGMQSTYRFLASLASQAELLAAASDLKFAEYENAVVATWFRYAGVTALGMGYTELMKNLLTDFFEQSQFPAEQRMVVENAIRNVAANRYADTVLGEVVSDAVYSQLADLNFPQNILAIREEFNRVSSDNRSELEYMEYFLTLFIKSRYYTSYAIGKYAVNKQKNFEYLENRISLFREDRNRKEKLKSKVGGPMPLSNKETEDLFKIAFRNYNHLISVADSKASLLINVNSIIISVMIAFVLGKIEKSFFILWPTIILLTVCLLTILLAILASRPQNNSFLEDKNSLSYQRFFFGSFDMVDPTFIGVQWDDYYTQLMELFSNQKETVYLEVYKESYNVRKVLSKKFNYLSMAYWVFLFGLLISVIAFVLAIYGRT